MIDLPKPGDETVLPFQLDRAETRGRIARVDGMLNEILSQHDYPAPVEALVAEMVLLTALIGPAIKLRWKLSLQVQTNGPVRMIATDFYAPETEGAPARIRAYASFDADRLDDRPPMAQLGDGYFAVIIDQGRDMTPYQGISPLNATSLAKSAEDYFMQSEQLPSRFALGFGRSIEGAGAEHWRGGGVMLQNLPEDLRSATGKDADTRLDDWRRVNMLLDTVDVLELTGPQLAPAEVLLRLFHEEVPRVFDPIPLAFGCQCSEARVRNSLSIYSAKDIEKMTTDAGRVTADCQFCGAHYDLDPATVGFEATGGS